MSPPSPPSGDDLNDLQSAANNLRSASVDIANSAKAALDLYKSMPKVVEEIGKKFQKASTEMKGLVLLADSAQDAFKGMSDYGKTLAKGLAQEKSLKNVKATLAAIAIASKKAAQSPLLDAKQVKAAEKAYEAAISKLKSYRGVKDAAFDTKSQEEALELVKQLSKEYGKLATATGRAKLGGPGGIREGIHSVRRNMIDAGIMKAGRVEKYAAYGEAAVKLKEAGRAKREAQQADFAEKRGEAQKKLLDIPGMKEKFKAAGMVTAGGDIDWAKAASNRKALKQVAGGVNPVDMRLLGEATTGPKTGMMGKLLGGGMIESGMGSVASAVGQAAIPLAIAEAVKDLVVSIIDKNAEMNKQAETLAAGGLLNAGGPMADVTLSAARQNLTPSTFLGMNKLGLGFERNVKMAQAVIEAGYNVEELAQGGPMGARLGSEFGPGTFGEVQKIAATSGRVAGLGDADSIKLTMKLLMQYRQSMEGTGDFFTNLNKDTRAAGISTMKYISILQEVTDQFDRMNKNIDQTSGVLRALSRTGRMTAEDLQENLKIILGDPKRDVGMQIYLDMMQRQSGQAGVNAKQQGNIFEKEADNAFKALAGEGGLGIPNVSRDDIKKMLQTPGGREQLNSMLTTYQSDHPDVDVKKFQTAQGALNTAAIEGQRKQLMGDFAAGKISAVDYQSAQAGLGKSAQVQANENLAAAKEVMRHSGISPEKLYGEGAIATTQKAQQLLQAFSLSPTLLRDTQMQLQNQGQGRLKVALGSESNAQAVYDKLKDKMGEGAQKLAVNPATGKPETAREALERWTRDKRYGGKFLMYLRGADEGLNDIYNTNSDLAQGMDDADKKAAKAADEAKARAAGAVTQNTAEIFANAFASFFNEIIGILEKIRVYFAHSSFFGGVSEGDEAAAGKAAADPATQKLIDLAAKANEMSVTRLKSEAAAKPDDKDTQDKLQAALARQKEFQQKYGKDTGLSSDDFRKEMADIRDVLLNLNSPVTQMMQDLNVPLTKTAAGGTEYGYDLTAQQYQDQSDKLSRLGDLIKVTSDTDKATGQTTYHVQTTNNYSAQWSQLTSQQDQTTRSTERVTQTGEPAPQYHTGPRGIRVPNQ